MCADSDDPRDQVGRWSETKLEIVKKYAKTYSKILTRNNLTHCYIDAFAGSGVNISRDTNEFVLGSPLNALLVKPEFEKYFFIEADGSKIRALEEAVARFPNKAKVRVMPGDCNDLLLNVVFPQVRWHQYRRELCFLDPYGLHVKWDVIRAAGKSRSIDMFLNFPIMDINRNPVRRKVDMVQESAIARMNEFWGDDSWRHELYDRQPNLFGTDDLVKMGNAGIVSKFENRLKDTAGFKYVSQSIPMRNTSHGIVYYLVFASHKPVASNIVNDIFAKYRYSN